jgi:hypothetical protein
MHLLRYKSRREIFLEKKILARRPDFALPSLIIEGYFHPGVGSVRTNLQNSRPSEHFNEVVHQKSRFAITEQIQT